MINDLELAQIDKEQKPQPQPTEEANFVPTEEEAEFPTSGAGQKVDDELFYLSSPPDEGFDNSEGVTDLLSNIEQNNPELLQEVKDQERLELQQMEQEPDIDELIKKPVDEFQKQVGEEIKELEKDVSGSIISFIKNEVPKPFKLKNIVNTIPVAATHLIDNSVGFAKWAGSYIPVFKRLVNAVPEFDLSEAYPRPKEWTMVNEMFSGVLEFAFGMSKVNKLLRVGKSIGAAKYGKLFASGGVTDFVLTDTKHDNLVKVLRDMMPNNDFVQNDVLGYLATEIDDTEFEKRLKEVVIGAGLSIPVDATVKGLFSFFKLFKKTRIEATEPETKALKTLLDKDNVATPDSDRIIEIADEPNYSFDPNEKRIDIVQDPVPQRTIEPVTEAEAKVVKPKDEKTLMLPYDKVKKTMETAKVIQVYDVAQSKRNKGNLEYYQVLKDDTDGLVAHKAKEVQDEALKADPKFKKTMDEFRKLDAEYRKFKQQSFIPQPTRTIPKIAKGFAQTDDQLLAKFKRGDRDALMELANRKMQPKTTAGYITDALFQAQRAIVDEGLPVLPFPVREESDDPTKSKFSLGFIINPAYLKPRFMKTEGLLRAISKDPGKFSANNMDTLIQKMRAVIKNPNETLQISDRTVVREEPRIVSTIFRRKFKESIKHNKDVFDETDMKKLTEVFMSQTQAMGIDPATFDYDLFIKTAREGGLKNPIEAMQNFLELNRPATFKAETRLTNLEPALARKEAVEQSGQDIIKEGQDFGLARHEIFNNRIAVVVEEVGNLINRYSSEYASTPTLRRWRVSWPGDAASKLKGKKELPPQIEKVLLEGIEGVRKYVEIGEVNEVTFQKIKGTMGASMKGMDPKAHQLNVGVKGNQVNDTSFILDTIKDKKKSNRKAVALLNHRDKINNALEVRADDTGKLVLKKNKDFTKRNLSSVVGDGILENLVSGNSTYMTVLSSAAMGTVTRYIDDAFVDLIRFFKRGVGKITGDEWLQFQPPESELKSTFLSYLHSVIPAMKDWGRVTTMIEDADHLLTNQSHQGTFLFDAFHGAGMAGKGARAFQQMKRNSKGMAAAFADFGDKAMRTLNATWGIGKLQAVDAFTKRLMIEKEIRRQVVSEVFENYRRTLKHPPSIEDAKEAIKTRLAEAHLNYSQRKPDSVIDRSIDEIDNILFRSQNATIMGGADKNLGASLRALRKTFKDYTGPVGRLISMFSNVAINAPDYFIQRLPGLQFANPKIRKEWMELGMSDQVMAKAMTGMTMMGVGMLGYHKLQGKLSVTDSLDDRFRFREVYGYFPSADINIQLATFDDGTGRKYSFNSNMPLGQHLNFAAVQMHYMNEFKKGGDATTLINESLLNLAKNVTPAELLSQYSEALGGLEEFLKADKGAISFLGSGGQFVQRLFEVGLMKETKDFVRGHREKAALYKGTLNTKLDRQIDNAPIFSVQRIAEAQLPLIDFDRPGPEVSWNGYEMSLRDIDQGAFGNFQDYMSYLFKNKSYKVDGTQKFLWEINSEVDSDPLKLSPSKSFNIRDIYMGQVADHYSKGKVGEGQKIKTIIDEGIYRQNVERDWLFNNYHHQRVTKLSAGFPVKAEILKDGRKQIVSVDFVKDVKRFSSFDFGQVGKDLSDGKVLNVFDYNTIQTFKSHIPVVRKYGTSKEEAVRTVVGKEHFVKFRDKVGEVLKKYPPMNYRDVNNAVTQVLKSSFRNVSDLDVLLKTPEARFMQARLRREFDDGQFEGFGKRRRESERTMRDQVNSVVRSYNELAKTIYLLKVVGQSDNFKQKILKPLEEKHITEVESGLYNLPMEGQLNQLPEAR